MNQMRTAGVMNSWDRVTIPPFGQLFKEMMT